MQGVFEPTELGRFTEDLASNFRSAMEKAGLEFRVGCEAFPEPVYVDRDMWEKIVLNLISNALKFTFEGSVTVALKQTGSQAEFTVSDTGAGIPGEELPHIFERFHRVEAPAAEPSRARASVWRWCRNWSNCTADPSA